ncbi:MAG: zinc transporter ZupT [Bacteroidota bacterium]|nr:zinc transporter ZupT [Bacteroidota bacterium]
MAYTFDNIFFAFLVTILAGTATGIGSAVAYFAKRTNFRFLSIGLGFSGGVMLFVSFTEILPEVQQSLVPLYGQSGSAWTATAFFFVGIVIMLIIDRLIPEYENPHELPIKSVIESYQADYDSVPIHPRLMRMGLVSAAAIAIHNFPEGIATFLSSIESPRLGVAIGIAIAIHNIPEGIAVSVPIYYATGNKRKAFGFSFLSGVSEPVGALCAFLLLQFFATSPLLGLAFAAVAGIMVYISLDELLPTAREYGSGHDVLYGIMGGMAVMALSLLLMN